MKRFLKFVIQRAYHRLTPVKIKIALALSLILEKDIAPTLMDRPPGSRILVLAPHMDDEVLGCGGTLYKHVAAGDRITIVYMTDGRKGAPGINDGNFSPEERERREDEVVRTRREESRRATALLKISDLRFLNNRDQELEENPKSCSELARIIEEVRPDLVYVPFMTDRHKDHWMTNRVFLGALSLLPEALLPERCCGYEVRSPLYPNCIVDITKEVDAKRNALAVFTSQMAVIDFSRSIIGLHAYRSMTHLNGRGFAEAFYLATPDAYKTLFRAMRL